MTMKRRAPAAACPSKGSYVLWFDQHQHAIARRVAACTDLHRGTPDREYDLVPSRDRHHIDLHCGGTLAPGASRPTFSHLAPLGGAAEPERCGNIRFRLILGLE